MTNSSALVKKKERGGLNLRKKGTRGQALQQGRETSRAL